MLCIWFLGNISALTLSEVRRNRGRSVLLSLSSLSICADRMESSHVRNVTNLPHLLLPSLPLLLHPAPNLRLRYCSERSKRRTKTVINTCNPIWSQSFVYSAIRTADLLHRVLEVTIWDYDRYGANEFLGEVTIDLSGIARASAAGITLENLEATWHQLSMTHGNGNAAAAAAALGGVGVRPAD